MTCPECGWLVRGGARLCPNCGAELATGGVVVTCPHCQAQVKGRAAMCPECGQPLTGEAPAAGEPAWPAAGEGAAHEDLAEGRAEARAGRVCQHCQAQIEGPMAICPVCGEAPNGTPAPVQRSKKIAARAAEPWPDDWFRRDPAPPTSKAPAARETGREAKAPAGAGGRPGARVGPDRAPATPARQAADAKPPLAAPRPGAQTQWTAMPRPAVTPAPHGREADRRGLSPLAYVAVLVGLVLLSVLLFALASGALPGPRASWLPFGRTASEPAPHVAGPALPTEEPTVTETPAPSSTPEPPTAVVVTHTVLEGETLQSIAEQYGVSVEALAEANNLSQDDEVEAGRQLVIPGQATTPTPPLALGPTVHVVQPGENLRMIAEKYGVSVDDLTAENGIGVADILKVGQELKIPGAGGEPAPTPTEAPTATPSPTPTPKPTGTAFEYSAPDLLSPADGTVFRGAEDILLNWSSVGLLGDDTWYVVKIWTDDPAQPTPSTGWTRTTAWRIPASSRPLADAASHRFSWSVTVMRAREGQEPVAVSPVSTTRSFDWY